MPAPAFKPKPQVKKKGLRATLHNLIEEPKSSKLGAFLYVCLMSLVIISAVVLCMQTLPDYKGNSSVEVIESVCAICFTVEFVMRVVTWQQEWYMMFVSVVLWIDVLSILPFYVNLALESAQDDGGLQIIGILRLLRLLRLLKLVRHYEGSAVLAHALQRSSAALLVPLFFLLLLCFVFAGVIYYVEGDVGGNEDFDNIFKAVWFVMVTLSTVGYGDITPTTTWGKVVTVPIIIAGLLFMAMPISIVGNNFTVIWEERQVLFVVAKIHELLKERSISQENAIEVFREMDSDGDGSLDIHEFRKALGVMGISLYSRQLAETFHAFDGDMDGSVDYAEFCEKVFPDRPAGSGVKLIEGVKSMKDEMSKLKRATPGTWFSRASASDTSGTSASAKNDKVEAEANAYGVQLNRHATKRALEVEANKEAADKEAAAEPALANGAEGLSDLAAKARRESTTLQAQRRSKAESHAISADERLGRIERNLARLAAHFNVELEGDPETDPTVFVTAGVVR